VVTLGVGGVVIGSNMGFKFNLALSGGVDQWVSLPYNSPYSNADDVLDALMPGGGTVTRFLPTVPPTVDFWNGSSGVNFATVAGEGLQLNPLAPGTTNAVVVGSHNPFANVPSGGFISNRDYLIAVPYHTTAQNADDLLADLPSSGGTVTRLIPGTPPSVDFWNGSSGVNFAVVLGEGYVVRVLSDSPGYIPAHF
jgi:hypothetical protein